MFKLLPLLGLIVKHLFFDNKSEYDIMSPKFNARKVIILLLMSMSIFMNVKLADNIIKLTKINKVLLSAQFECHNLNNKK